MVCSNSSKHITKHPNPQKINKCSSVTELPKLDQEDQSLDLLVLLLPSTLTLSNYCRHSGIVQRLLGATVNIMKWLIVHTLCYLSWCGQLFKLKTLQMPGTSLYPWLLPSLLFTAELLT